MKTVTVNAEVGKAYGETLPKPLPFSFSYDELEKGDAIPAKEQLDDEDIRNAVNAKRKASARSVEQNKVLRENGISAPTLEDPDVQFKTMVRTLVAAGAPQDVAEQMARATLASIPK